MRILTAIQKLHPTWTAEILALLGLCIYISQSLLFAHTNIPNLDEGSYLVKGYLFATKEYRPFEAGISTGKPPFAFLIPGYIQLIFGPGLRTGRYLAVFFGIMAVVGTWLATKRMSSRWLAAASVWVLAASPMVIKYYSGAVTQSLIACLMAWMLAFSLGEKRTFGELTLAGFLAGVVIFTRQNMLPVLPLLIAYAFLQYGRRAWGLVFAGSAVAIWQLYFYWPHILQLWSWLPGFKKYITMDVFYKGGGVPIRWQPNVDLKTRALSISQSIRFHFIPLAGSLLSLLFIPNDKKKYPKAPGILLFFFFFFSSGFYTCIFKRQSQLTTVLFV